MPTHNTVGLNDILVKVAISKTIYAISGPTASGKTALGVELALRVGGEVINFDSVQIYKGIEIATAKPTVEEMRDVPHHLINYVEPSVNYTAADWARDAAKAIEVIESRSKTVVLVGGTGFYLRTLRQPLFDSPPTDPILREKFREIHRDKGSAYLHSMLAEVDPELAENLGENDHVRVIRGLEVFHQTGKRMSDVQLDRANAPEFASRIKLFVLSPPRDELYARINARTEQHFANGLIDEVKQLRESGVRDDTNALGAHAYRRVCEYLRGERDLESAIELSKQNVRNYAKRQFTWFRSESDAVWLEGFGTNEGLVHEILAHSS
ncbi:MAG: tRNA (adenosine(37)-N6)-dimethylallyltransferase MiaA [Blastocatellia bacterium]|nr:tRNA (adenosine(37)-N6)-dimethylallyltransferase MiaA [Blastocatellia bacterium]